MPGQSASGSPPRASQTLNRVRADRARAIEPQLAGLNDADRQTLADAVTVLRRLLDDSAARPATRRISLAACPAGLWPAPTTYGRSRADGGWIMVSRLETWAGKGVAVSTATFGPPLIVWLGPRRYSFPTGRDVTVGLDGGADIRLDGRRPVGDPTAGGAAFQRRPVDRRRSQRSRDFRRRRADVDRLHPRRSSDHPRRPAIRATAGLPARGPASTATAGPRRRRCGPQLHRHAHRAPFTTTGRRFRHRRYRPASAPADAPMPGRRAVVSASTATPAVPTPPPPIAATTTATTPPPPQQPEPDLPPAVPAPAPKRTVSPRGSPVRCRS